MEKTKFMAGMLAVLLCAAPAMSQTVRRGNDDKKTTTTTKKSTSGNSVSRSGSSATRRTSDKDKSGRTTTLSKEKRNSSSTSVRRDANSTSVRRTERKDNAAATVRRGENNSTVRQTEKKNNTTTVRRGENNSTVRQTEKKSNTTTVRRDGNNTSKNDKKTTTTVRRNENSSTVRRTDKKNNTTTVRRGENGTGKVTSSSAGKGSGVSDNRATEAQTVKLNSNVTRRGLGPVNKNDNRDDRGNGYGHGNEYRMDKHDVVRIHPHDRGFMPYDRPGCFYGHDPHYFGYRVEVLPPRCRKVRYYGVDYYFHGDVYYRVHGKNYVVCRPPVGVMIDIALDRMRFKAVSFAFYNNVYRMYSGFDSYSRYIDEQNRQIARNNEILARQNAAMAMNLNYAQSSYDIANRLGLAQSYAYADRDYYYEDGVFYIIDDGRYRVIVPPAGALVDELPDDFETIMLGNAEYYKVDDTVYRVAMISGRPYLEVLGQMYGSMARQYRGY